MLGDTNVQDAYKESTWGKKVDGEYVIDGYKFKGRQAFKRTREKLESLLKRGTKSEINGIEYKVLDARVKGIELEVEIQVLENSRQASASSAVTRNIHMAVEDSARSL